jgi:HAD superfamily hydrolase (TIGR01509 family)
MAARTDPLRLVIFDCDGVLVDSEPVADRLVAAALTELGWIMTAQDARAAFLGRSMDDMLPIITARLGSEVPPGWTAGLMRNFLDTMAREGQPIDGALAALDGLDAMGLPWRVASNSGHDEMAVKFRAIGILDRVAGKLHSFRDVPRGKPAPDIYLAAAAAGGAPPRGCVVIEDSVPGVTAGVAAGMTTLGFAAHGDPAALRAAGAAACFTDMAQLPDILSVAWKK